MCALYYVPLSYHIFQLHLWQRVSSLSFSASYHGPAETLNFPVSLLFLMKGSLLRCGILREDSGNRDGVDIGVEKLASGATPPFLRWKPNHLAYSTTRPTVGLSLNRPQFGSTSAVIFLPSLSYYLSFHPISASLLRLFLK